MTLYTGDLAITKVPHDEVWVSTNGDDTTGDGTYVNPYKTIAYALSSITDASSIKPYVIKVGAGVFVEVELTCKAYVNLSGDTMGTTLVEPDATDHNVINLVTNSALNFLTVQGAGVGFAGVYASNCGVHSLLHKVSIYDCDTCVYFEASSIDSELYLEYVDFNGEYVEGLVVKSNGFSAFCNAENFYTYPTTTSATSQVRVDGSAAEIEMLSVGITGNGTDNGVLVTNGAILGIVGCVIKECDIAVHADTSGTNPDMYMSGLVFEHSITWDLNIANATATGQFTGFVPYLKKNINRLNSFFITNKDAIIITVAKKGGDFTSVKAAISAITDESTDNRYNIMVGPGIFVEDSLVLQPFISIRGVGAALSIIEVDTPTKTLVYGSVSSSLYDITIAGASGVGGRGIYCENVTGDYGEPFLIHNCIFENNETQMVVDGTAGTIGLQLNFCRFDPAFKDGIVCTTSGGNSAFVYLGNTILFHSGLTVGNFMYLDGAGVEAFFSSVSCTNTSNAGTALRIRNGAKLIATSSAFSGFDKGIHIENVGTAPIIYGDFKLIDNVTYDVQIDHPTAVGNITGVAKFSKITNAAISTMSLTYTDPIIGDYNVSRTTHTRGLATDITNITTSATTTVLTNTGAHATVVTGSTAGQIIQLPNATTLRSGHQLWILNAATVTITTQWFGGSDSIVLFPSGSVRYILRDNTTTAGIWNRAVSSSAPFQGTSAIISGYGGNAGAGRYLEFVAGNASDGSPFIVIAPSTLVGLSIANGGTPTTASVGIFRTTNLVTPIASISLTAQQTNYIATLAVNIAAGDRLAVQVTSGSMLKPFVCFYIAGQ